MKKLILVAGIAVAASASFAQVGGRSFNYNGSGFFNGLVSGNPASFYFTTEVTIAPYLYVVGNFGAQFQVDGWGTADSGWYDESVTVFHNQIVQQTLERLSLGGPVNPTLPGGSGVGTNPDTVDLLFKAVVQPFDYFTNTYGVPVYTVAPGYMAGHFGALNSISLGLLDPAVTGGCARTNFSRKIQVKASNGPGLYSNSLFWKFTRL